ncbi:unnamed protein product [Mycena citricolor]|uniref:Uncharacterized protein n=1 Tax=Mycena citricolor TaxID=2018698 RepID=A0AAD2K3D9_9AGAR|nr:unnamed protein product [Mycena citricolor]
MERMAALGASSAVSRAVEATRRLRCGILTSDEVRQLPKANAIQFSTHRDVQSTGLSCRNSSMSRNLIASAINDPRLSSFVITATPNSCQGRRLTMLLNPGTDPSCCSDP